MMQVAVNDQAHYSLAQNKFVPTCATVLVKYLTPQTRQLPHSAHIEPWSFLFFIRIKNILRDSYEDVWKIKFNYKQFFSRSSKPSMRRASTLTDPME